MSEKTYVFDSGANNISSMLPALLQNKGIDPTAAMAMMNGNRGGFLGNNGLSDIIALIIVAAIFGNGNGFGFGGGGNNQAATAEREMLMQALQRNGVDISQLAQSVNCSNSQILQAINAVASSICGLGNQMGQNTNQILTALLQGNNAIASQIAECCCSTKQVLTQGFADLGYATRDQTCAIEKAIAASTAEILAGQRAAEMRDLQNKLEAEREKVSQQATAINNYQQTQAFGQMLHPISASLAELHSEVDSIKCKLPKTETIVATPDYVPINRGINVNYAPYSCLGGFAYPYGFGGFNNGNGSFF